MWIRTGKGFLLNTDNGHMIEATKEGSVLYIRPVNADEFCITELCKCCEDIASRLVDKLFNKINDGEAIFCFQWEAAGIFKEV